MTVCGPSRNFSTDIVLGKWQTGQLMVAVLSGLTNILVIFFSDI